MDMGGKTGIMRIITGMHRSGTSLMARLFFEAGANLGDPATFYRPDRWNRDGYYEQPEIHAVNMPLIHGPWGRLAYFRLPETATILKRGRRRMEQIQRTAAKYDGCVVKETRFCLTLPAWRAAGTNVEALLICLRDPLAVARSICKRNWTTRAHAFHLWTVHNRRLLENAAGIPYHFVDYGRILDPRSFDEEMRSAFRFFNRDVAGDQMEFFQRNIVKPALNHGSGQDADYPPAVQELWDDLRRRHAAQFESHTSGTRQRSS